MIDNGVPVSALEIAAFAVSVKKMNDVSCGSYHAPTIFCITKKAQIISPLTYRVLGNHERGT